MWREGYGRPPGCARTTRHAPGSGRRELRLLYDIGAAVHFLVSCALIIWLNVPLYGAVASACMAWHGTAAALVWHTMVVANKRDIKGVGGGGGGGKRVAVGWRADRELKPPWFVCIFFAGGWMARFVPPVLAGCVLTVTAVLAILCFIVRRVDVVFPHIRSRTWRNCCLMCLMCVLLDLPFSLVRVGCADRKPSWLRLLLLWPGWRLVIVRHVYNDYRRCSFCEA